MESTTNKHAGFAEALGLSPGPDELFVGKIRGFPVGLKFITSGSAVVLLFQVRHWLKADAPELKSVKYEEEVAKLVADRKIEIEFDDRMCWLTFLDGDEAIQSNRVARALNSILATFEKAGFIGDPELCHYCQKEKVKAVSSAGGRVGQICQTCLDERLKTNDRARASPAAEAVPIFLMSPAAALVGALLWAGFWVGQTLLFERLNSHTIFLPRIVMVGVMVCIGILSGGPVGWIIRQNRRRGNVASASAAILFGSIAVALGEIFYILWVIYHEFQVLSFSAAFRVLPDYYLNNDPVFLGIKALTAFISIAVAYMIARPENPRLKL